MDRLTEKYRGYIRIKGCTSLYKNEKRKGAFLQNAIVRLAEYEDAEENGTLVFLKRDTDM